MKNAFYFIIKALSILKIFKFLSRHFVHLWKTAWLKRLRLTKFMTPQPGFQIIAILILPYNSQCTGSQTMKFGQLTESNKRNIFLQILWRKWGKETSSRPLFKLNMTWKQVVCSLVSIYFNSPQLVIFQEKCFSCCILLTDQNFIVWLPVLLEILGNMCISIVS